MATMEQVAKLANVSVATVSRVLNNPDTVNEDTRNRVLEVIKNLNYEPNILGRSLRKTQTNVVLVLVHAIDNPFFSEIVNGIENVARVYDYDVIMANNHGSKEIGNRYIGMLKNRLIDGIILLSNELDSKELDNLSSMFPIVQVIEYNKESTACAICIDYYQASKEIIDNFITQGRKKIAFINTNICPIVSTEQKYQAYIDSLKENKLQVVTQNIQPLMEFGFDNGYQITIDLLKRNPDLDAIFTCSDMIASGAIAACKKYKREVPKDIAVSGFDDIFYSRINDTPITTVSHDTFNLGLTAMNIIIKMILHEELQTNRFILPHQVIYRESAPKK